MLVIILYHQKYLYYDSIVYYDYSLFGQKFEGMSVYFLTEENSHHVNPMRIKVGYSCSIKRRSRELQTGNPDILSLMGEIRSSNTDEDKAIEKIMHERYAESRFQGEWFYLHAEDVIDALKDYSPISFITVGDKPFEIVSRDRKGLPEYANAWQWGDVEHEEFCPACGWAGGWSYNENYGGERCLNCGATEHDYDMHEYAPEQD